jgi:hypothetical protein
LELFCPACGLAGENFITEDVLELAMAIVQNYATDLIFDEMKKLERKFKKGVVTFKARRSQNTNTKILLGRGLKPSL